MRRPCARDSARRPSTIASRSRASARVSMVSAWRASRAGAAAVLAVTILAACATGTLPLPPPEQYYFDEETMQAVPVPPTYIDYPPIEPVELPMPVVEPAPPPTVVPETKPPPPPVDERIVIAAAAPTTLPVTPSVPPEDLQTISLLADLTRYSGLGPDELKRELNTATQALAKERTDTNRIRLAMLYTLARSGPPDDQRALQLLENVAKSGGGPSAIKQLASVLQLQVAERVRAVRDEQVKANDALQKLERLRDMERSLLRDRVRSGGGGAGGAGGGGGGGGGGR